MEKCECPCEISADQRTQHYAFVMLQDTARNSCSWARAPLDLTESLATTRAQSDYRTPRLEVW